MKAGVLLLDVKREKINEFKTIWNGLLTELRKEKGFQNVLLLVDHESGKSLSIGFFDNEENAKTLQSSAVYQKLLSDIRPLVNGTPQRVVCDVSGDLAQLIGTKRAA